MTPPDEPREPPKVDPRVEAERRLRMAMAAEARAERDLRKKIQVGFYGCLTLIVALFLLAVFFF